MRIEINAGGLDGAIAISEYQSNISSFVASTESMISSFKAVTSATYNLSGGVGNLQEALDNINTRIQNEEDKKSDAIAIRQKSNDFLNLAVRVDKQVSTLVNKNKDEFYRTNPWLKPDINDDEKSWIEKGWNWLCETGEAISEGVNQAWNGFKDTVSKAWAGLVDFYEKHKKAIATVLLVVAAIAVLVLVPAGGLLATMAIGAAWGTLAGAAIGGVSGGLQSKANGGSFWDGFENGAFSGALGGAVAGAAFAGLGFAGQAIGHGIGALSTLGRAINVTSTVTRVLSFGMSAFDTMALADLVIDPSSNPLYNLNAQAHSSSLYNGAQVGIGALAALTGGISSTMNTGVQNTVPQSTSGTEGYGDNINFAQDSMSDKRYFSQGNNYNDFKDYWESGGQDYEYVSTNSNNVQMINARDIEGVSIYESDLNNPSQFWSGPGRYGETAYRDFILDGKIQNTPVKVSKIVSGNKTFYLFGSDGRHRILTAQELGIDIPAIIEGVYTHK